MTTRLQDSNFLNAVLPNNLLEDSIEWIGSNMNPEEVFDEKELRYWALNNGFSEE